jgi:hypothetical protein
VLSLLADLGGERRGNDLFEEIHQQLALEDRAGDGTGLVAEDERRLLPGAQQEPVGTALEEGLDESIDARHWEFLALAGATRAMRALLIRQTRSP